MLRETGNDAEAKKLLEILGAEQEQRISWFKRFKGEKSKAVRSEMDESLRALAQCAGMAEESKYTDLLKKWDPILGTSQQ